AFEHFRAAIKAVPDYASAHNNLGNALRQRGLVAEATDAFLKASQLDTNYWQARFNLANSYVALDRLDDAIAEYEAVLRIEPDFAPAHQALEQTRLKRESHTP
ncbi:MAG TPA: tetratricopeptide repeat protein, partial [Verrucomicrobiota bacterium]|nr:tetratricopeptide repeat protein [Verrucomicrobiota bacterium]